MKITPFLLLAGFCATTTDAQTTVPIPAIQDTSIYQSNGTFSGGGAPALFVGANGMNSPRRAFIEFDIADNIPAGATITGVQLTLTLAQTGGATSANIGLYDLSKSWAQGTAGSTASGVSGSGSGFAAGTGDPTWTDQFYSASTPTAWTTAGGDHAGSASATLALSGSSPNTDFTWLSTPQLVADVQGWLNSPSTDNGWELINANEGTSNSVYEFYSSEWDNAHFGGSSTAVPSLQVTYTPAPEPSSGLLTAGAALAFAGAMRLRRRIA